MESPKLENYGISENAAKTIPFFERKNKFLAILLTFTIMSVTQFIKVFAIDGEQIPQYLNMLPWIVLANLTLSGLVLIPVYYIIRLLLPVSRAEARGIQHYLEDIKVYKKFLRESSTSESTSIKS